MEGSSCSFRGNGERQGALSLLHRDLEEEAQAEGEGDGGAGFFVKGVEGVDEEGVRLGGESLCGERERGPWDPCSQAGRG